MALRNSILCGALPLIVNPTHLEHIMNGIIYLVGLIVVVLAVLSLVGLR